MQVESGLTIKYSGRVPPLDLSNVCHHHHHHHHHQVTNENDLRWQKLLPKKLNSSHQNCGTTITTINRHNNQQQQQQQQQQLQHLQENHQKYGNDNLPIDPRDWTRAHVSKWLINMAVSEGCLDSNPDLQNKFPMNGKALCLMSLDMYLSRVPIGGKMLYRDFRVRLAKAMSL